VGVAVDEALSSGAEVASIGWRYEVGEAARADWAVACVERANARAARLAAALTVRILGVHAYQEDHVLPQGAYAAPADAKVEVAASRARMSSIAASLGDAVSNTERAGLRVTIAYRVGDRDARS
jgi:uncharacterized protein YggE